MLLNAQKQKLLHLFDILDFNHNGILQKDDLISIAKNIDMFVITHEDENLHSNLVDDIQILWERLQLHFKNSSLFHLTKDQWLEFMIYEFDTDNLRVACKKIDTVVRMLTHIFDQSSDGKLSKLEFMTIFVSLRVPVKHVEACFDKMDVNGDGYISEPELSKAVKQYFLNDKYPDEGHILFELLGSTHFSERKSHTRRY